MNAYWIAPKHAEHEKNCYFRARKKFEMRTLQDVLLLHITAESYYLLTVNGRQVGRGPARGTHRTNYYDTWDVACFMHPGDNEITVLCQCMNEDSFIAAPSQPALLAELEGYFGTDASWDIRKCKEWRQDVNTYSIQVGFLEWRDFRRNAGKWEPAVILPQNSPVMNKKLLPRDVPMLRETVYYPADIPVQAATPALSNPDDKDIHIIFTEEEHRPLSLNLKELLLPGSAPYNLMPLPEKQGIALVFDFDHEIVGRFELDITAQTGTIIDIGHDEELWNNRIKTNHSQDSYTFTDRYISNGSRLKIGNTLHERGFRMVQIVIRNLTAPALIHGVKAIDSRYPVASAGTFNSSDQLLNRIWQTSAETLSACITDVYTDCPWRERSFWVNDLIVENRTGLQLFGDKRINARAFRMAADDVFPDGLIPGVCPCPRGREDFILLTPNLYVTEMLSDYYLYTGDAVIVRELIPVLSRILEHFAQWEDNDGLLNPPEKYWNFIDWSYELNNYSLTGKPSSLMNYFYLMALRNIIRLNKETCCEISTDWMEKRVKRLPGQIAARFYRKEHGFIADSTDLNITGGRFSQLAHALALLTDACTPELEDVAKRALVNPKLLIPEFYFHFFIFHALDLTGQAADGLARIRKYWGDVVKTGSPTFWEAGIHGKGKVSHNGDGSLCHGFATAPVDFIQTIILGIKPIKPGFKTFSVEPQLFDLDFAEGRVPTPAGNISLRAEKHPNGLSVSMTVPPNLIARTDVGDFNCGFHKFELTGRKKVYA